ncbi:MAG: BlaI/MecI/CopY family transcriptional regulator [Planctomycetota bacterium]
MADQDFPRPTEGELAILHILWKQGPSTVRQVHEALSRSRNTGYTTTLKLLQIMNEKGLVDREATHRSHVYTARLAEEKIQHRLVTDLLKHAFDGSAQKLIMQALSAKKTSAQELAQIRSLLDELERGTK